MAWPTSKPDSNKFSSDGDSIKDSRPELKTMSDAVNNIVDFVDTTGISNGDVLVYDSATDTIKPGAGGGGGALGPLTANLETENFLIGRIAPDSASGAHPTAIQFTDNNNINLISTASYFPDSVGEQVFLDAGTVTLQNYIEGRRSSSTGNLIPTFDHAAIRLFSAGPLDSAGADETSLMGLEAGGRGVLLSHGDVTVGGSGTSGGHHQIYLDATRGVLIQNTVEFDSATNADSERIRILANGEVVVSSKIGFKIETPLTTGSVTFKIDRESTTDWGLKLPEQGGTGFMYLTQDDDSGGSPTSDFHIEFNQNPGLSYNWTNITSNTTISSNNAYFFTGASQTINLPAYPTNGDMIHMIKASTANVTINPNGQNWEGTTSNRTMNSGRTIVYMSSYGWITLSVGV